MDIHILPDQIHKLSVSFFVPELKRNFGGTAGNIAYNLSLLNSNSILMATVGDDFSSYEKRLSMKQNEMALLLGSYTRLLAHYINGKPS